MPKKKKPVITPNVLPSFPSEITPELIEQISDEEWQKDFENSDAYKKYIQPMIDEEKARKKQRRNDWLWNKGLPLCNLVLALIAAITGILALIMK